MKGQVSELDTRLSDLDLPNLEHGAKSMQIKLGEAVLDAMARSDKKKAGNK